MCIWSSKLTTGRVWNHLELSDPLVCDNHAQFQLVYIDSLILHDIYFVNYVNSCKVTFWKNFDMRKNMFSTGTPFTERCLCFLCCGRNMTDDSELHITQRAVSYRYALHALLLVQMSVLQSTVLPSAVSNWDSEFSFPLNLSYSRKNTISWL